MRRKYLYGVAIAASVVGLLFMVGVGVLAAARYHLTWRFDPTLNASLATVVGSVGGALFTFTTAVFLYLTLQDQQQSRIEQEQDRNYGWLSERLEKLELSILAYRVPKEETARDGKSTTKVLEGNDAWDTVFQRWQNVSFAYFVHARLVLEGRIDPDSYLDSQGFVLRTVVTLNNLIEDARRMVLAASRRNELVARAEGLRERFARYKERITDVRDRLRTTLTEQYDDMPRERYAPEIRQVVAQIDEVLTHLPDPKKSRYEMDTMTLRFSASEPSVFLQSNDPPTVAVDRLVFNTDQTQWGARLTTVALHIEIEAVDPTGKQACYLRQPFSLGMLFDPTFIRPVFNTGGTWMVEGRYNPHMAVEVHKLWRVKLSFHDLEMRPTESFDVTIRSDARRIPPGPFNKEK